MQRAGRQCRGVHLVAIDDEYVVAGALGHVALSVEHDGLLVTGGVGLDLGEDVVEVVERLDRRIDCVVMVTRRCDRHDLHALLVQAWRVKLDLVGDDDHLRVGAAVGVQAKRAGAPGDDQPNVAVGDAVSAAGLHRGIHQLLMRHRDVEQDGLGGIKKAVDVFLELEYPAVIGADALEHPVAV